MAQELNGDEPLSPLGKLRYIATNLSRMGSLGGPRTRRFASTAPAGLISASPSRMLGEQFLAETLPRVCPPRSLNVLDIGCGSGYLVRMLAGLGYSGSYTGVDVDNRFRHHTADGFKVSFRQQSIHEFEPTHPIDLLLSVSALEHIADDTTVISRLAGRMAPGGVQVHLVPARAALAAYLWHGYRQYNPRMLSDRFGPSADLVKLGGLGTLAVHLSFITFPEFLLRFRARSRWRHAYSAALRAGVRIDAVMPFGSTAIAVVVQ